MTVFSEAYLPGLEFHRIVNTDPNTPTGRTLRGIRRHLSRVVYLEYGVRLFHHSGSNLHVKLLGASTLRKARDTTPVASLDTDDLIRDLAYALPPTCLHSIPVTVKQVYVEPRGESRIRFGLRVAGDELHGEMHALYAQLGAATGADLLPTPVAPKLLVASADCPPGFLLPDGAETAGTREHPWATELAHAALGKELQLQQVSRPPQNA